MREALDLEGELSEWTKQQIINSIPETNLVLFMPALQGRGSTLIDRSQSASHATITRATWTKRPSGIKGLRFAGNTTYAQTSVLSSAISPPYTLILWAISQSDNVGWFDGLTYLEGCLFLYNGDGKTYFNNGSQIGGLTVDATTLQMYVVVVNGASSSLRAYPNATTPATGTLSNTALTGFSIGISGDKSSWFTTGDIFIPQMWSRALTTAEMLRIFNRQRLLMEI